jgi:hypothetical protein
MYSGAVEASHVSQPSGIEDVSTLSPAVSSSVALSSPASCDEAAATLSLSNAALADDADDAPSDWTTAAVDEDAALFCDVEGAAHVESAARITMMAIIQPA